MRNQPYVTCDYNNREKYFEVFVVEKINIWEEIFFDRIFDWRNRTTVWEKNSLYLMMKMKTNRNENIT